MSSLTTALVALALTPATVIGSGTMVAPRLTPVNQAAKTDAVLRRQTTPTEWKIELDTDATPDPLEALRDEAIRYASLSDGWDGPSSIAVSVASRNSALAFIDVLPPGLPLPKIMVSPEGEIGFYWDLGGGYADISFSENGRGSFFSRTTSSQEEYLEDLAEGSFSRDWFYQRLGEMAAPSLKAA
jgi:hypothetical protein